MELGYVTSSYQILNKYFYAKEAMDRGHMAFALSVCFCVCLQKL